MARNIDRFQPDDLEQLRERCPDIEVRHFDRLTSTNDVAMQLARESSELPKALLLVADEQTAGRGRGSNEWWATKGSLTFSLLIDTDALHLSVDNWPRLSLTTGLAICEVLQAVEPGADVSLKWPNDVYLTQRKVCGILVEAPTTPAARLVIGVGVNVNNSFDQAPAELREKATSLTDVTGRSHCRTELLVQVLTTLLGRLQQLAQQPTAVLKLWRDHCLLTGRDIVVELVGRDVRGRCHGVNDQGALLVEDASGQQQEIYGGVVVQF